MSDVSRDITVTASLVGGDFQFTMSGSGVGGPADDLIEFNKDSHKGMKKSDRFLVRFNLDDQTGQNLRFVKHKENAMWAKVVQDVNDPCPQQGDHLNQFKADQVIDDALVVKNRDDDRELIKFALNFIRKGGDDRNPAEYVQYDPIGENKNGGIPFVDNKFTTATTVAVACVVVAVAIAYVLLK